MEYTNKKDSLCWDCKRACGKDQCSWAARFEPVSGWNAEQNELGFLVTSCPQYIEDDRIEVTNSVEEIVKILGITQRTFYRWISSKPKPIKYINKNYFSKMNYHLFRDKDADSERIHIYRYTLVKNNK